MNIIIRKLNRPALELGAMIAFFCIIMKREALEKVGYLSEEFGLGFGDDDDYCITAINARFRIGLTGKVLVFHTHRITFDEGYG